MLNKNSDAFSVLMSVYAKEVPGNLESALDSVFNQSLPPNEVVLVKDGPLPSSLEEVIERQIKNHPEMRVVSLDRNVGLGSALEFGLDHCSYELVARMDTDDVCASNRFECQIPLIASDDQLSVIGSWVAEFASDPNDLVSIRKVPEHSDDIKRHARKRSPVNHPTVVFRKSHIQAVGSYNNKHLFYEDYCLWTRLIMAGYRLKNIPIALVFMRTGEGLYKRRGGFRYIRSELIFFIDLFRIGFIGPITLLENIATRIVVRLMPSKLRKMVYICFARSAK